MNLRGILNSTTIADRFLLSILILLSLSGIIFIKEVLPEAGTVRIESAGRLIYVLPLDEDRMVSVKGVEGETVVEIKDHKVRIRDAPCPNKLCMHQGWIEYGVIVCIPNRVVITIGNDEYKKIVDAITG